MRRLISIPPILFQFIITFLTLLLVFMLFFTTKGNEKEGIVEGLGFENSKVTYAAITILLTMAFCFLIGLPIRLIPGIYQWWTQKPIINILAFLAGLLLIFFYSKSFFTGQTENGESGVSSTFSIGDPFPVLTGWLLLTFSLLHFYPISISKWTDGKNISLDTFK